MAKTWTPYCGIGPGPEEVLTRWNFDPPLLAGLAVMGAVLALARDGEARARVNRTGLAALAVLALAYVSPLCAWSSALFSARVAHDALLMTLAAPLLAWSLPHGRRPGADLALATALQAAIFWAWHAPVLYATALSHDGAYWAMQLSLGGSALLFWRAVRRAAALPAAAALLATMLQMGLLGALLTFAAQPLYAPHLGTTAAWGLAPLADQQLAGLLMWGPLALAYLGAALVLMARWLGAPHGSTAAEAKRALAAVP